MTPTNEQIIAEAKRRSINSVMTLESHIIEVVREGWKPPPPAIGEFREWASTLWPEAAVDVLRGHMDYTDAAKGFVAGARMAREQEQQRAKGLVDRLSDLVERVTHDGKRGYVTGVNAGEMISARVVLAKYRGEA